MTALSPIASFDLIDRPSLIAELRRAAESMTGIESLSPEQTAIADLIAAGIQASIVTVAHQPAPLPVPNPCVSFEDTTEAYEAGYQDGLRAAR